MSDEEYIHFYWIKYDGSWMPAQYIIDADEWYVLGSEIEIESIYLDEIGDVIEG